MVALLVCFGVAAAGRINVGTVYLTEWLPRKNQTAVHVIHHSGQAFSYIAYTMFFWHFSSETVYVSALGCAICILTTILACFIPESPRLLCAKGRVEELQKSINIMAWFNRKSVTWTKQELQWIEENAASQNAAVKEKRGGASMAQWVTADVLVSQRYTIVVSSLPPETDEPALKRMLTQRGMKDSDLTNVCVAIEDSNSAIKVKEPHHNKKSLKRKLSYKVSFRSEAEMIAAIKMLKSSKYNDGFDFEVNAVLPKPDGEKDDEKKDLAVVVDESVGEPEAIINNDDDQVVEDCNEDVDTGSKTSSYKNSSSDSQRPSSGSAGSGS